LSRSSRSSRSTLTETPGLTAPILRSSGDQGNPIPQSSHTMRHPPTIPHPDNIIQPVRVGAKFYVVFAGTHVGIFGNWFVVQFCIPFTAKLFLLGLIRPSSLLRVSVAPINTGINHFPKLSRPTLPLIMVVPAHRSKSYPHSLMWLKVSQGFR
jgi:hypothetical protein